MRGADDLLARARLAAVDAGTAHRVLPLIQLEVRDSEEGSIAAACERARLAGVAALGLSPRVIAVARRHLGSASIRLVTAANSAANAEASPEGGPVGSPVGSDDIAGVAAEVAKGIAAGADEVQIMAPTEAVLEGDVGLVGELVEACRAEAVGRSLAVGLDVAGLADAASITAAARAAIMAGAERLVVAGAARSASSPLQATALMMAVLEEAAGRVGIGIEGVETLQAAAGHLQLIDDAMGPAWAGPTTVRLISPSLLDVLEAAARRG